MRITSRTTLAVGSQWLPDLRVKLDVYDIIHFDKPVETPRIDIDFILGEKLLWWIEGKSLRDAFRC